jgi:quercetin dioxygenase-like cupin family protein
MKKAAMKKAVVLLPLLASLAAGVATWGSPASGVTPTLLARGAYGPFKVKAEDQALGFQAKARNPIDVVVRQHDYLPQSSTGWHTHPGPVFITVTKGTLTFYEYDDPTCTPHVVSAGEIYPEGGGYVDTGHGHIGRNETDEPAQDVTVIVAPPGEAFRGELDAPSPYCGF